MDLSSVARSWADTLKCARACGVGARGVGVPVVDTDVAWGVAFDDEVSDHSLFLSSDPLRSECVVD